MPSLPAHPSLEHLKKEAKALLKGLVAGDQHAQKRYLDATATASPPAPKLADAQFALAREYGFTSWPKLKAHLESGADPSADVDLFVRTVKSGNAPRVAELLRERPALARRLNDPLPGFHFGGTALLYAASHSHNEMIDVLLAAGADINQRSHWWAGGFGVLDHDDAGADPAWLDFLLSRGARVDAYAAARHNRVEALRAILAKDPAAARMRGGDGQTPLHVAASVDVARLLLEHGADIDARDVDHESTPAQYLVRAHPDVARYLVSRGATTDLLLGVGLGDLALVRRHLDADPAAVRTRVTPEFFPTRGPHASDHIYNWTLWRNASAHAIARKLGHEDIYQELLSRSADDLRLAVAAELGDAASIRELIARRPDLARDMPPHIASRLGHAAQDEDWAAVRVMLDAGWPINAPGPWGASVLHWTAWHGNTELARELLARGADPKARDASYQGTPYNWTQHAAREGWHPERGDYAGMLALLKDL